MLQNLKISLEHMSIYLRIGKGVYVYHVRYWDFHTLYLWL